MTKLCDNFFKFGLPSGDDQLNLQTFVGDVFVCQGYCDRRLLEMCLCARDDVTDVCWRCVRVPGIL